MNRIVLLIVSALFLLSLVSCAGQHEHITWAYQNVEKSGSARSHYILAARLRGHYPYKARKLEESLKHLTKAADLGDRPASWQMYLCSNTRDEKDCWFRGQKEIMDSIPKNPGKALHYLKTAATGPNNIKYSEYRVKHYDLKKTIYTTINGTPRDAKIEYFSVLSIALRYKMIREKPKKVKPEWGLPGMDVKLKYVNWLVQNPKWEDRKIIKKLMLETQKPLVGRVKTGYNEMSKKGADKGILVDFYIFLAEASDNDNEILYYSNKAYPDIWEGSPKKPAAIFAMAGVYKRRGDKTKANKLLSDAKSWVAYQKKKEPGWAAARKASAENKRRNEARLRKIENQNAAYERERKQRLADFRAKQKRRE